MKLTNYHRQAFVSAVMLDLPSIDYAEQFKKLIEDDMLVVAPPKIAALLKDKALRCYLLTGESSYGPPGHRYSSMVGTVTVFKHYEPSAGAVTGATALQKLAKAQMASREAIEAQIAAVIQSCTTLKAAHDRLPEFAKYLPEEAVKGTMLPAIANLASELAKMGWPKSANASVAA
jgi:hypothetical protein